MKNLKLFPKQDEICKPVFESREQYEAFQAKYYKKIKPILDAHQLARARSEHQAWFHIVR
jgi:hypothetical protein